MEEKEDFIERAYRAALSAGLCHNRSQFAELVGFNRSSLYRIKEPQPKTIMLIEKILADHGVVIGGNNTGIVQTGDTATAQQELQQTTADRLLSEMQAQREMYDRHLAEVLRQNSQLIQIITKSVQ